MRRYSDGGSEALPRHVVGSSPGAVAAGAGGPLWQTPARRGESSSGWQWPQRGRGRQSIFVEKCSLNAAPRGTRARADCPNAAALGAVSQTPSATADAAAPQIR